MDATWEMIRVVSAVQRNLATQRSQNLDQGTESTGRAISTGDARPSCILARKHTAQDCTNTRCGQLRVLRFFLGGNEIGVGDVSFVKDG